ncbi:sigma-70 family RNA polymerase sigma factor [Thermomicrobium sp. CFH 73360]|uniref:RNA polymerase sigma factor n=1 Tax=Thermomicrobium sp. CFH 73360 TaxID=2951987 RepID=UPI00207707A7|nr:sigma-70 family RNA polymerase sigma factor [Thermomicrobium sp. CFH 73360]MCM8746046.1 sigma-70 family RNA polymerase sigma factor [Thermomicrobium sp. CFH 73360]
MLTETDKQPAELEDEAVLLAAAREDPNAFAELYLRYLGPVYRYLLAWTGSPADAEDLAQETFLRAYRTLDTYRPRGSPFLFWLLRIARNVAIDASRRRTVERARNSAIRPLLSLSHEHFDDRLLLEQLLRQLTPGKQELLALRFAAGLSTRGIARLLGKREGAVRKQLFRIIRELREAYDAATTE